MLSCEERGSVGTLAGVVWLNPALTHTAFVWDQLNALYACIYLLTWIPKRQKMSGNTAGTDVNIVLRLWPFSLKRIGLEISAISLCRNLSLLLFFFCSLFCI